MMIAGAAVHQPITDHHSRPGQRKLLPCCHLSYFRSAGGRGRKGLHVTTATGSCVHAHGNRIQIPRPGRHQSSVAYSWTIHNSILVARLRSGKACWRYVGGYQSARRTRVFSQTLAFANSKDTRDNVDAVDAAANALLQRDGPSAACRTPQVLPESHAQLSLVARQAGSISMVGFVQAWQQLARHFSPRMKDANNTDLILRALKFTMSMLQGSALLADGSTPLQHALAVASSVAELGGAGGVSELGADAVAACLAAAVLEQQPDALEAVESALGADVALLAHQVQRVRQCPEVVELYDDESASMVRETCLAFYDVRAIVVELLWRWYGLQNMQHLPQYEQQLRAMEALQIYTPLGHGLGLGAVSMQMEDRCLEVLFPGYYKQTSSWLHRIRRVCEATLHHCQEQLLAAVRADPQFQRLAGGCVLRARTKSSFSLMKKMLRVGGSHQRGRSRQEVFDLLGLRAVVEPRNDTDVDAAEAEAAAVQACYIVQDIAHRLWPSLEQRRKDYIHKPKSNGYQSLHTTLVLTPMTSISAEPDPSSALSSTDDDDKAIPLQIHTTSHTTQHETGSAAALGSTHGAATTGSTSSTAAYSSPYGTATSGSTSSTAASGSSYSTATTDSTSSTAASSTYGTTATTGSAEVTSSVESESQATDSDEDNEEEWPRHLELQIRTQAMDRQAEQGNAAHNAYKGGLDLWQAQQLHGWARELQWHVEREREVQPTVTSQEAELEAGARALFNHMDRNGDGMIQAEELEALLQEIGADVHTQQTSALEVLDAVDSNHDLLISFEEFLELHRQVQLWKGESGDGPPDAHEEKLSTTPHPSQRPSVAATAAGTVSSTPSMVSRERESTTASSRATECSPGTSYSQSSPIDQEVSSHTGRLPSTTVAQDVDQPSCNHTHPTAALSHDQLASTRLHSAGASTSYEHFRLSSSHTSILRCSSSHSNRLSPQTSAGSPKYSRHGHGSWRPQDKYHGPQLTLASWALAQDWPSHSNHSSNSIRTSYTNYSSHNSHMGNSSHSSYTSHASHSSRVTHPCTRHRSVRQLSTVRACSSLWNRHAEQCRLGSGCVRAGFWVPRCSSRHDSRLHSRRVRGAVGVMNQAAALGCSTSRHLGIRVPSRYGGAFLQDTDFRREASSMREHSRWLSQLGSVRAQQMCRSLREGEALVAHLEVEQCVDEFREGEGFENERAETDRSIPREQLDSLEASLPPAESAETGREEAVAAQNAASHPLESISSDDDEKSGCEETREGQRKGDNGSVNGDRDAKPGSTTGSTRAVRQTIAGLAAASAALPPEEAWDLWESTSGVSRGREQSDDVDEEQYEEIRPTRRLRPAPARVVSSTGNGTDLNGGRMTDQVGSSGEDGWSEDVTGRDTGVSTSDEEDDYSNGSYRPLISEQDMGQDDDQPGPSSREVPLLRLVPVNDQQLSLLDPQHNLRAFIPGITIPKQGPLIISNSLQHFPGTDALVDFQTPAYDRLSIRLEFIRHRWTGMPSLVLQNCSRRNRRRTTAGVFVNGRRVLVQGSVWLYPGDVVSFGTKGLDFTISVDPFGPHSPILQTLQAFCGSSLTDSTAAAQLESVLQGGGQGGTGSRSKPGPDVDRVLLKLYLKSPEDAADLLQKLAVQYPEHSGVWYTWALLALKQRNWSLARTMHRTARAAAWSTATRHASASVRALPAKLLQIQGSWARMEWNLRNYATARRLYRSAVDIARESGSPADAASSARLLHQWASLESDANNVRNARVLLSEAMRRFPTDAAFYVLGGSVETKAGNMDLARMFLVRAYQLSQGGNERVYTMLSKVEIALGYIDDARALLQEGMRLFPRNVSLYNIAANLELDQGDADLAMSLLEQGLGIDAVSESAMHCRMSLAKIHAGRGNMEVVRQLLQEGLELHPKHVPAMVLWASLERKAGFLNQAETLARKAQKVSTSTNEHVAGELASIYAAKGEAALSANLMRHVNNLRELHMHKAVGVPSPVAHERFFAQQRGKKERHIIRKAFQRKVELGWVQPRKKFDVKDGAWVQVGEDAGQEPLEEDEDEAGVYSEGEWEGRDGTGVRVSRDTGVQRTNGSQQSIGEDVRMAMEQLWTNGEN